MKTTETYPINPIEVIVQDGYESLLGERQPGSGSCFVTFNFDLGMSVQARFDEGSSLVHVWTFPTGSEKIGEVEQMGADSFADHLKMVAMIKPEELKK